MGQVGEDEGEAGGGIGDAVDVDFGVHFPEEAVADTEAEAGTLADFTSSEEGVEDFWEMFRGDAGAVVFDGDGSLVVLDGSGEMEGWEGGFGEGFGGEGVDGVLDHVQEDLGEAVIHGGDEEVIGDIVLDMDPLIEFGGEHAEGDLEGMFSGDGGIGAFVGVGEAFEFLDDAGDAEEGVADILNDFLEIGAAFLGDLVGVSMEEGDGGEGVIQGVIDFVHDAGGETAEGGEFFGLNQLQFGVLELLEGEEEDFAELMEDLGKGMMMGGGRGGSLKRVGRVRLFQAMTEGLAEVEDHGLHLHEGGAGQKVEVPFVGEDKGKLFDLDTGEGLLEDHEVFGVSEAGANFHPGMVGIGCADDDLEGGIDGPELADGFDPVPVWGHADVHEGEGEGAEIGDGLVDEGEGCMALANAVQCVRNEGGGSWDWVEGDDFEGVNLGGGGVGGAEDGCKIGVDDRVIVHNEDPSVGDEGEGGGVHWRLVAGTNRLASFDIGLKRYRMGKSNV